MAHSMGTWLLVVASMAGSGLLIQLSRGGNYVNPMVGPGQAEPFGD